MASPFERFDHSKKSFMQRRTFKGTGHVSSTTNLGAVGLTHYAISAWTTESSVQLVLHLGFIFVFFRAPFRDVIWGVYPTPALLFPAV